MPNKIQIKRSTSNSSVTGLSAGELAFTANGNILYIGNPADGASVRIAGLQSPGTLTANQALVANTTSGIDKVIVANLVPTNVWANGAAGVAGQFLTSNSSGGVYWANGVAGSDTQVQFNDNGVLGGDSGLTYNKTSDTLSTNSIFATSTVNAATLSVGTSLVANSSRLVVGTGVGLSANGTIGNAGQVLHSNGSTVYWSNTTADITSVTAGNGLTGGGSSGDLTLDIGQGNGISVSTDAIAVNLGTNSGLVSNTSGLFIEPGQGLLANSTGLHVGSGNGISISADAIRVQQANGIAVDTGGVRVDGGSTLTVNNSGTHVNTNLSITSLTTSGDVSVNGNTKLGDSSSDVVSFNAYVNTNINPSTNVTYSLGTNNLRWFEIHAQNVHSTDAYFDGSVQISGDLTVTGNVVSINVATLAVEDSLIQLATNNTSTDLLDIGFYGNYQVGGGSHEHAGFFRDASDAGVFKLFAGLTEGPTATVNTSGAGYSIATLQSYLTSAALISNATHVAITANSTVNVSIVANTLTLSSPLVGTSGGTGLSSYTAEDILVANTSNGFRKLSLGSDGHVLQSNGSALVYGVLDGGTF